MIEELIETERAAQLQRQKEFNKIILDKKLNTKSDFNKLDNYYNALFVLYRARNKKEYVDVYKTYIKLKTKVSKICKIYDEKKNNLLLMDKESIENLNKLCCSIYSKHLIGEITLNINELFYINSSVIEVPGLFNKYIKSPAYDLITIDAKNFSNGRAISMFEYDENKYYDKIKLKYNLIPKLKFIKEIYNYSSPVKKIEYESESIQKDYDYYFNPTDIYKEFYKDLKNN